jgi:CheY-like chemotaxis protein
MEAIGQLAGGIAHDFNNLLTGIIGYADLLHSASEASDAIREAAAVIRATALRGADLAKSLLTLARRAPHRRKPVDVHDVLREVADLIRRTFDRRITLATELTAPQTFVNGDDSFLSNALLNLAINARDAMPHGGTLSLRTWNADVGETEEGGSSARIPSGRYVIIEVRDTGTGMSRETRERIFEPFYTTKEVGKGTGLGLSMVYGTVRAHDGVLQVESEPGVGTAFRLYLPLLSVQQVSTEVWSRDVEPGQGRVLVVDDEALVRDIASRMLHRLGYQAETAADGAHALDLLRRDPAGYDLVILDHNMPGITGHEVARRIRAAGLGVPLVLSSGYFASGERESLLTQGFADSIAKPYTLGELSRVAARYRRREAVPEPAA